MFSGGIEKDQWLEWLETVIIKKDANTEYISSAVLKISSCNYV